MCPRRSGAARSAPRPAFRPNEPRRGADGEDATLDATIAALEGVRHVLCAKIGDCPKGVLEAAGIAASDAYAYEYAETAIGALYAQTFARAQDRAVA
jgi:nitrogen fixation protein NifB